jgi:transcriptional regulator with XRE-family HTH domain
MTGQQLRRIRLQMELSQRQLAAHIRTTRNTIARWERGEIQISEPVGLLLEMVAKGAGIEVSHPGRGRRDDSPKPAKGAGIADSKDQGRQRSRKNSLHRGRR